MVSWNMLSSLLVVQGENHWVQRSIGWSSQLRFLLAFFLFLGPLEFFFIVVTAQRRSEIA